MNRFNSQYNTTVNKWNYGRRLSNRQTDTKYMHVKSKIENMRAVIQCIGVCMSACMLCNRGFLKVLQHRRSQACLGKNGILPGEFARYKHWKRYYQIMSGLGKYSCLAQTTDKQVPMSVLDIRQTNACLGLHVPHKWLSDKCLFSNADTNLCVSKHLYLCQTNVSVYHRHETILLLLICKPLFSSESDLLYHFPLSKTWSGCGRGAFKSPYSVWR